MKAKQKPGVVFEPQVHRALQRGIHTMVNAVRPTLGPVTGGVAIDHLNKSQSMPEFLTDGGTIARRIIELPNRNEDMGAMLVRAMITRQHDYVGDGTATVAVLFEEIFNGGLRYIASGGNAMQLRRYLERALPLILDELDCMVFRLEGQQALTSMAFSLCHDQGMAELLGEAFDVLGEYGRIEVREDYGRILRKEYVEGSYFHTGLFSRALAPENSAGTVTFENPAIFACDFEIENYRDLIPVLQAANEAGVKQFVIIARSLSEQAIALLVANNKLDKFKVMALKLPGLNPDDRMIALDDLSLLTRATPFIAATGGTLENVTDKHFGRARRVWAESRAFSLVGGGGDPKRLREHIRTLKTCYRNTKEAADRQKLGTRIGNLLGGSLTLFVGSFTKNEIELRKNIAERTVLTMRAAIQEGVIPGGGIALMKSRSILKKWQAEACDPDEYAAYRILYEAFVAPARTIFRNAGYDPSEVMAKLSFEAPEMGFDVLTGQVVNVCTNGILDSAEVIKTCVHNAISTAALALTIDALVHVSKPVMVTDAK
ncbi:MAG: TCP-1/cpn60 chaperonin family protein [Aggregatilineales bacterium]